MPAVFRLDLLSPNMEKFAEITDVDTFQCITRVNHPGLLNFQVSSPAALAKIAQLEHGSLVELYRRYTEYGIDWYKHFGGVYLDQESTRSETITSTVGVSGYAELLNWRIVAWKANGANRSRFLGRPAREIMFDLVNYNIGNNATSAQGRLLTGTFGAWDTQYDGDGNTINWYCAYDNLLESLQGITQIGGGDFSVDRDEENWVFQFHAGQLGEDRHLEVIFSVGLGNMGEPKYSFSRSDERTAAIVAGQGEEADREVMIRYGSDHEMPDNHKEVFVNASDIEFGDSTGLANRGDQKLETHRARETFSFSVLQTPAAMFKVHYDLGDLVTVVNPFTGKSSVQKISEVNLTWNQDGSETIEIGVLTP